MQKLQQIKVTKLRTYLPRRPLLLVQVQGHKMLLEDEDASDDHRLPLVI